MLFYTRYCDSIKLKVILNYFAIKYAVFQLKLSHVQNCKISVFFEGLVSRLWLLALKFDDFVCARDIIKRVGSPVQEVVLYGVM